jgi:hypothetical protein
VNVSGTDENNHPNPERGEVKPGGGGNGAEEVPPNVSNVKEEKQGVYFSDFWEWIQDTDDITTILDTVFMHTTTGERVGGNASELKVALVTSKLTSEREGQDIGNGPQR